MEIMEKDIRRRVKIRNASVSEKIQAYLINNYGATTSLTSLQKELHKLGMGLKRETLISTARRWKILYITMPDRKGMKSAWEESENWNVILFCVEETGIIVMCR